MPFYSPSFIRLFICPYVLLGLFAHLLGIIVCLLKIRSKEFMDPHPLDNLFKRSNYDEPIASEFCALDYLYEVLLEIRESENCDEVLYEAIHDRSLNKKHDCNDVIINSINVNCANNMQNPKLGDASFAMSTICCNDHEWGDSSYDLENLFKPHDEYEIDNSV